MVWCGSHHGDASSEMTSNCGCFLTTAAMASSSSFRKTFPKGAEGVLNIKILRPGHSWPASWGWVWVTCSRDFDLLWLDDDALICFDVMIMMFNCFDSCMACDVLMFYVLCSDGPTSDLLNLLPRIAGPCFAWICMRIPNIIFVCNLICITLSYTPDAAKIGRLKGR